MMVVSDTSPLNYLILIEEIDVLPQMYGRVIVPSSVNVELRAPETPDVVRRWIEDPPGWLEISTEIGRPDPSLDALHLGERHAISLALRLKAAALLIDERRGRREAEDRGLKAIGTLGVLVSGHERGLLDLAGSITRLRKTTFHASAKLLSAVLQKYRE